MNDRIGSANRAELPLAGIRVLDLTRFLPGPMATQFLADLGADVVKVELPPLGDLVRAMGPVISFHSLNRGKRSALIDYNTAEGAAIARSLAAEADIFVESGRPGSLASMGLDYSSLKLLNPRIIYCSVSGYGQGGPYAHVPSHGLNMDGLAGMLPVQTGADGRPFIMEGHPNLTSLFAGHAAAMGMCAALVRRSVAGMGSHIDASCWDCGLAGDSVTSSVSLNSEPLLGEWASPATPKYAPYRTSDDRYLMVCAIERKFWREFCRLIDRADLIEVYEAPVGDPGPHGIWGEESAWVYDEVAKEIAKRSLAEWTPIFIAAGLPVTPIHTRAEALRSEHGKVRNLVVDTVGYDGEAYQLVGPPLVFDGARATGIDSAPALGQHTEDVLANRDRIRPSAMPDGRTGKAS